jgi:hydrogenase maturation factor HypF (carbamoyltransferase family)
VGTILCDAASRYVSIYNQISFTAEETITSKLMYEREAMSTGVQVQSYSSDNGVSTSKEFMKELHTKGQGIKRSGVGSHHHNGVAKTSIKNVVQLDCIMMIHVALRWPNISEKELWPMAMQHDVHLHNHTPKTSSGMSPEEV